MNDNRDAAGRYAAKDIDVELVRQLYTVEGMSSNVIGQQLGVAGMTIRRLLRANGVKLSGHHYDLSHWKGGIASREGYVLVMRKGHPRADRQGYVNRSILVWEEANGQPFPDDCEPHHLNHVTDDDRPENIFPVTHSEHAKERLSCST